MSQLQKKCLVGSMTMHVLLLLTLLAGPAFLSKSRKPLDVPEITFEPAFLIDEKLSNPGGAAPGGPAPAPSPVQSEPPPATPPSTPRPAPRQPPVQAVEPEPAPAVVKPLAKNANDRDAEKLPKAKPVHQVLVSRTKVPLNQTAPVRNPKAANRDDSASSQHASLAGALRDARKNLSRNLSAGTDVRMPAGQGGGSGAAYANYAQEIQRRYKLVYDRELHLAGDIADGQVQVETAIVILRDGSVSRASIVKRSGNAALDRLAQRVLDSVRQLPACPAGATDASRTFNIIFDLKPRIGTG